MNEERLPVAEAVKQPRFSPRRWMRRLFVVSAILGGIYGAYWFEREVSLWYTAAAMNSAAAGELESAERSFAQAVRWDASYAVAYREWGKVRNERFPEEERPNEQALRACELDPHDLRAAELLFLSCWTAGDRGASAERSLPAVSKLPLEVQLHLITLRSYRNEHQEAMTLLETAQAGSGENEEARKRFQRLRYTLLKRAERFSEADEFWATQEWSKTTAGLLEGIDTALRLKRPETALRSGNRRGGPRSFVERAPNRATPRPGFARWQAWNSKKQVNGPNWR